jgi:hypothetical protein
MNKTRPLQMYRYHCQADLMWPDGTGTFNVILYVMSDALKRVLL